MHKFDNVVWGVIGVGDVCEKKSAPAMNKIEGSSIKSVMRRNGSKAEDYAKRHGISEWTDKAEDLINDPEINAIYIATPPNAHAEMVIKAANAGKAIYVEKPMARNHKECLDMIAACDKASVPLFVAYYRRALPNFLKVKELISTGVIGDVRAINVELYQAAQPELVANVGENWRVDPAISGGGFFHDLASHQLDFLDYAFGPIANATGYTENKDKLYNAPDVVSANFRLENGVLGTGNWCFASSPNSQKDTTTILGTKGQIQYASFMNTQVIVDTEVSGKEVLDFEMPEHIQQPLIQQIVDELMGNGACVSTGKTGARTNKVMDMICS